MTIPTALLGALKWLIWALRKALTTGLWFF
jgi:hypothetical protein